MHRITAFLALAATVLAQTPADPDANAPAASPAQNRQPKQLPPPGVAIPDADRAELTTAVAELGKEIAALNLSKLGGGMDALIPDVEVFHKAVDWALRYDEFYNVKEVATARTLLAEGKSRAAALKEGEAPWTTQTGLVVRGYRSKIDGSVQPFGVVVPATWKGTADKTPRATWVWNHGRGETLSELSFIAGRMKSAGEFTPADTFVVHPYGRYCNATKFAGEVDVFEALDSAKKAYPVDNNRLVNAGFSMGGASAWHLGVHHSGLWAASHAGAGFAETAEYAGVFAAGKTPPPWWEVILYRWYDATVCAANLANHPMFAYYGEQDKQKQATQIMKRFAEKEGVKIEEFVGPGVGHKYEANAKADIEKRVHESAKAVDQDGEIVLKYRYIIYSPIYSPRMEVGLPQFYPNHWNTHGRGLSDLTLEKCWERAEFSVEYRNRPSSHFEVKTKNIKSFYFFSPGSTLSVDGVKFPNHGWSPARQIRKYKGHWGDWHVGPNALKYLMEHGRYDENVQESLEKTSNACGPIDHAFMDSFVFVKPTSAPLTPVLGEWTQRELAHATKQWRGIFRGDAPTVDDSKLTDEQIKSSHLVLWGDPSSNAVLKRIADKLPVKWTADGVEFGGKKYSTSHVPVLIFPNPLNPARYVVLNSGFTFSRSAASGTNSQQTPKLPDWAIVDISVPPDDKFPGKIVDAGFFDEQWKFTTERPK